MAKSFSAVLLALLFSLAAFSDPLPPDLTYRPLPTLPFSRVKAADEAQKAAVMQRQSDLLNERYDLSDRAMQNVMMSGGRKIYPYLPGGYGTSIGSALEGKATLARTPDHQLDWAFLRPEEPAKFIEGTGKYMNTVPPNDFSYFEVTNDLVQKEPVGARHSFVKNGSSGL